ncbi:MAG TPA: Clp protease N-terminal domain-containing protein [Acidimicrobiales bacterium]|nr:Clp protease N-terminal domain-containing protein [Acidimicrobiales bacterium]
MFERFSDRGRRVVVLAQEEARLLGHGYIGTEHLLLGIVHEGEGVAARALESLGIELGAVRRKVEETVGRGDDQPEGHIPFTPHAKKVLELSLREALQFGHDYIGTEHVLLGLIRESDGVAAQVLVGSGADLSTVRRAVLLVLEGEGPAPTGALPRPAGRMGGQLPEHVRRTALARGAARPEPRRAIAHRASLLEQAATGLVLRRFTVSACRVVLLAESEALRLGHTEVGQDHLLLGLLAEGEGRAAATLTGAGADLEAARAVAEEARGRGVVSGDVVASFADPALDALERSLAEALGRGSEVIDTEHLLLGLVAQAEAGIGLAAAAFGSLELVPADLRAAIAAADADRGDDLDDDDVGDDEGRGPVAGDDAPDPGDG